MWEASEREKSLLDQVYRLRDEKERLEIERIESGGMTAEYVNRKTNDLVGILVISIILVILLSLTVLYYAASFGLYELAMAMVFATGLGMADLVCIITLIVLLLRYFILNSGKEFWMETAVKLHMDNRHTRFLEDEARHQQNLVRYHRVSLLLEESEKELAEERAQKAEEPAPVRDSSKKPELMGGNAADYFKDFFR